MLSIPDSDSESNKEDSGSESDSSYDEEQEQSNSDSDDEDGGEDGDDVGPGSEEDNPGSLPDLDEREAGPSHENVPAQANDLDSDGNVSSENVSFVAISQQNQLRQSCLNFVTPVRRRSEPGIPVRMRSESGENLEDVELFSPITRGGTKSSFIWTYGGCKKDENGKLLRDKIYCSLCRRDFNYHGTGGNLLTHLRSFMV